MERLRLHNGQDITCLTTENETQKNYYCTSHQIASEVGMVLTDLGHAATVKFGHHGWMVVTRKKHSINT